jgi:hypothetical protein
MILSASCRSFPVNPSSIGSKCRFFTKRFRLLFLFLRGDRDRDLDRFLALILSIPKGSYSFFWTLILSIFLRVGMSLWSLEFIETLQPHQKKIAALAQGLRVTETNFVFCGGCLQKMCARDRKWHKCRGKFLSTSFQIIERAANIVNCCRTTFIQTMFLSIFHLKRHLGKNIMKKIMHDVFLTREDFCLWYRCDHRQRKKEKTRTKYLLFDDE